MALCIEMNSDTGNEVNWIIRFCIVILFALLGHSLTRLEGISKDDGLEFALVSALFASIALFIGSKLRPVTNQLEDSRPKIHFLGLKVGVIGFIIALCGWLTAIYVNGRVGFILAVVGILSGFVGMLIHFYFMFTGSKHA
jgi:uncharacterized protein YacL